MVRIHRITVRRRRILDCTGLNRVLVQLANLAIGLGNRLAIFQNKLVDAITRNHDVDLLLPGQKPCVYFVIISAQDSAYRFLSSLFSPGSPTMPGFTERTAACRCW